MTQGYLWKKGDRDLGPVSLAEMRKMIRMGTLGRFQQVSVDGGSSFAQASTFPELWESQDLIPIPVAPEPTTHVAAMAAPLPIASQPSGEFSTRASGVSRPARTGRGLALAGFIAATTGLVLTLGPLLVWVLRYPDGYWAVPLVFPLLVASITGLALSCIAMARQTDGFATTGLVVGICGSALGLVTAIGWLVSNDPRDAWIVRLTATAEADMQIARRNFTAAIKRYREHAPNDDHNVARDEMAKDLMLLTQAHKNLLQAASSTPRFSRHFRKLEDLKADYRSFSEAVKLQDKKDAQKVIDDIGQSSTTLKELLDLWDLHQTGQLTTDSVQAKFRDSGDLRNLR
ncbi:MAG: DUF4339 domain-containing protein [Planctomycetia bacterium]|nr:DUF4339 domain-containing protein [Planctomycetia bacterium]